MTAINALGVEDAERLVQLEPYSGITRATSPTFVTTADTVLIIVHMRF